MAIDVKVLEVRRDSRGAVFEPLSEPDLRSQRNVHVVVSKPGEIRGNHYHPLGTEILVVQGPALVRLREEGETADHSVPVHQVHRFVIPPGVAHAVRHEGDEDGLLIGFNALPHDPDLPDTVREVLIRE